MLNFFIRPFIAMACIASLLFLMLVVVCIVMRKRQKTSDDKLLAVEQQNSRRSRLPTPIPVRSSPEPPYITSAHYSTIHTPNSTISEPVYVSLNELTRISSLVYVNDVERRSTVDGA